MKVCALSMARVRNSVRLLSILGALSNVPKSQRLPYAVRIDDCAHVLAAIHSARPWMVP